MLTEESDNSRTLPHMEVRSEGVRAVGRRLRAELRLFQAGKSWVMENQQQRPLGDVCGCL